MNQSSRRANKLTKQRDPARTNPAPLAPIAQPFKLRRRLFILLCAIYVIWIAILILLYFTTVRPRQI